MFADASRRGYVAFKRHLGFKFLNNERMLRSWAAWAMARGDDVIVVDTMIGWACDASSSDTARKRLSVARRFAVWLHAEDQRHEIPPKDVLGPTSRRRPAPHLLTNAEIRTLMAAALLLPPVESVTPVDGDPKAPKSGEHKIWGLTFWIAVFSHNGSLAAGSLLPAMKASCVRGLRRVTRRAGAQRRSRRAA